MYANYQSLSKSSPKPDDIREQQQRSRSSYQLHRYNHEPVSSNFIRRDIPSILVLVILLVLIAIILAQILIVHTSRYGLNFSAMQQLQEELKQMDESMKTMLHENTLPINQWRLLFHIRTYLSRFEYLFEEFNNETRPNREMLNRPNEVIPVRQHVNLNSSERAILKEKNVSDNENEASTARKMQNYSWSQTRQNKFRYDGVDKQRRRKLCSEQPTLLRGRILTENSSFPNVSLYEIETNYSTVKSGGQWSPSTCLARHKVAIIIPYRDRFEHLVTLLYYLHPILQRQQLDYKIYVSEQSGNGTYNKGVLMNAGFIYASSEYDFQCFVFHDVDLIPEDDRNMYSCPILPRHMSVAVNEMNYKLTYEELIGGVLNIRVEHFLAVNGYSNLYWGWGAEDDDLYYRLKDASLKVLRPPTSIARYRMLQHTKRTPTIWNKRAKLLYSATKRYSWDGVSSARYNLTSVTSYPLFTHILIDVGTPPLGFS